MQKWEYLSVRVQDHVVDLVNGEDVRKNALFGKKKAKIRIRFSTD